MPVNFSLKGYEKSNKQIYPKEPLVYKIVNLISNKSYVGHTSNLYKRLKDHRSNLKKNKHHSKYLQNSFNKHGIDNFEIKIIEICNSVKEAIIKEQYWIDSLNTSNPKFGYNTSPFACHSHKGIKRSKETCEKHRQRMLGRKPNKETRLKMSLARIGKHIGKNHSNYKGEIIQSDLDGNLIRIWKTSAFQIAKILNIPKSNISMNLVGKNKRCGQFIFTYKNKV